MDVSASYPFPILLSGELKGHHTERPSPIQPMPTMFTASLHRGEKIWFYLNLLFRPPLPRTTHFKNGVCFLLHITRWPFHALLFCLLLRPLPIPPQTLQKVKPFTIISNSSKSDTLQDTNVKPKSLSEQLKTLSTTILSETNGKYINFQNTQLLSKPKSIWVNPIKAKRSVLSFQRQKRSEYAYNPQITDLKQFAMKLNECEADAVVLKDLLNEVPHEMSRENALLLLNSLKPWNKVVLFFDWVKEQKLFDVDTIFHNVVMKSLRFGRQFELIEKLANEMVSNGVELDNITYFTIITCARICDLFDRAVFRFERMYKTGLMPDEVTYSAVLDVYAKLGKVEEC